MLKFVLFPFYNFECIQKSRRGGGVCADIGPPARVLCSHIKFWSTELTN
jgi:hypothetical protein